MGYRVAKGMTSSKMGVILRIFRKNVNFSKKHSAAIRFPRTAMFSFLYRVCVNLKKAGLRNKMYFNPNLKACFFCGKKFQPITRVTNNKQEKLTICHVPHKRFLC